MASQSDRYEAVCAPAAQRDGGDASLRVAARRSRHCRALGTCTGCSGKGRSRETRRDPLRLWPQLPSLAKVRRRIETASLRETRPISAGSDTDTAEFIQQILNHHIRCLRDRNRRVLQLFAQRASSKATSAPEMLLFHATIASTPSDVGDGYRKVGRDAIQDPDTGLVYQNMSLAASIVTAGVAKGYAVALVSVCGFGEMGSDHTFTKQTSDPMGTYVHGLASFNGRSLPGIHAAEINRTMTFLAERAELSDVAGAVAMNQTDAAALHLAAISSTKQEVRGDSSKGISSKSSRKFLAVVGGVASYELVAATRLYKAPQWMDVPGVLQSYDLPDLAAAAAAAAVVQAGGGGNALIGGIDCVIILQPLDAD